MSRKLASRFAISITAIGLAAGGTLAATAAADTSSSETYGPGGDFATYCVDALQIGVGGGCFGLQPGATSVTATLKDDATQNTAGEIVFKDASGNTIPNSTSAFSFCGAGTTAIPVGATEVFVYADGPMLALGSPCGGSSGTAGIVTLTQSFPA